MITPKGLRIPKSQLDPTTLSAYRKELTVTPQLGDYGPPPESFPVFRESSGNDKVPHGNPNFGEPSDPSNPKHPKPSSKKLGNVTPVSYALVADTVRHLLPSGSSHNWASAPSSLSTRSSSCTNGPKESKNSYQMPESAPSDKTPSIPKTRTS